MLVYSFYEQDNRVRRYAETLLKEGAEVDVISLRRPGQSSRGNVNGTRVFRIQRRSKTEKGKISYLFKLVFFFFNSLFFLTRRHLKTPYDVIHVHSVPDFEVFATFFCKMMGAKIILDIHDIVPEFYVSKFKASKNSVLYKLLLFIEKISCRFADHVIIANDIWFEKLTKRSIDPSRCTAILNFPDSRYFSMTSNPKKNGDRFIILYPGSLNWHQGLDITIDAFSRIAGEVPHVDFHIYGEGPVKGKLETMARQKGLEKRVKFFEPVSIEKIAGIMKSADLGIIPKRNDFFGGEAFSTKTLEFMLLKVPILVSKTKIDSYYYNDDLVTFFEPENPEDLANELQNIIADQDLRDRKAKGAYEYAMENKWDRKRYVYLDLIKEIGV